MNKFMPFTLVPCLWLSMTLPHNAHGSGELIAADDHYCYGTGPQNATFTPARYTYVSAGDCNLTQTRLNLDVTVHWSGVGTYDPPTGRAAEDIIVPAPRIDQPSRPYGHFQVTMHCTADPWLNFTVKCDHIVPTVDAPLDHTGPNARGWKQPYPLAPMIIGTIQQNGRPFTSYMSQDAVNNLNRQYGVYQAQQKTERLQKAYQLPPNLKIKPGPILPRGIEGEPPVDSVPAESGTPAPQNEPKP